MCPNPTSGTSASPALPLTSTSTSTSTSSPLIPPGLPLYDAHCHPTDTPSSLARIGDMRAAALVLMSTRSQDQDLVADAASVASPHATKVIPAFGWHPWFSHQLHDDISPRDPSGSPGPEFGQDGFKAAHYRAVLAPEPSDEFVDSLPAPRRLSEYIDETRGRLNAHPSAMVGEIGIDKAFRLPEASGSSWSPAAASLRKRDPDPDPNPNPNPDITPGGREGRRLSPYRVRIPHQLAIMTAQLRLAAELRRAVSIHAVQAHGVVFDALQALWKRHEKEVISRRKRRMVAIGAEDFSSDSESEDEDGNKKAKPYPPRICLHSFSGPAQVVQQYLNPAIPASIFFSFSAVVNMSGPGASDDKLAEVMAVVPENRILVESDLHQAGEEMDRVLEEVYLRVCGLRGWDVAGGVRKIARNFGEFVSGGRR